MLRNTTYITFLFLLVTGCINPGYTQDQYKVVNIGFYNLENLFDTLDSPNTFDSEFTPQGAKLYNTAIYTDKLQRLSTVISQLGKDISPDGVAILGVAEVENRKVLEDLISQPELLPLDYQIVHFESPDFRGIDVGLLYQSKYFTVLDSRPIEMPIFNDKGEKSPTREILFISGIMDDDTIHILVNHWPSRRGGEAGTEPLRMRGAAICAAIKDSLRAINPNTRVIVMGDFNDDPSNKSLTKVLRAKAKQNQVGAGDMYNPFYEFYSKGMGSNAYRDAWSLFDQVILSPEWISTSTDGYRFYKARVFNERFLTQKTGQFKGYPLRTFSGDTYIYGYSDHFPVYVSFIKKQ